MSDTLSTVHVRCAPCQRRAQVRRPVQTRGFGMPARKRSTAH